MMKVTTIRMIQSENRKKIAAIFFAIVNQLCSWAITFVVKLATGG